MTLKYYLGNFYWGLIVFAIAAYLLHDEPQTTTVKALMALALFSGLLFPFAKKGMESVALKYSKREAWPRGLHADTAAGTGLYAMYYMVVFAVAIPVGIVYLISLMFSKKAT